MTRYSRSRSERARARRRRRRFAHAAIGAVVVVALTAGVVVLSGELEDGPSQVGPPPQVETRP